MSVVVGQWNYTIETITRCDDDSGRTPDRILDRVASLEDEGTLSQQEIAAESLLPERTVRLGLEQLQQVDVAEARTSLQDARRRLYSLSVQSTAETHQPQAAESD